MRALLALGALGALFVSSTTWATTISGTVVCEGDGSALAGVEVQITAPLPSTWSAVVTTDVNGYYSLSGLYPGEWSVVIVGGTSPDVIGITPPSHLIVLTDQVWFGVADFAVDDPSCRPQAGLCWMTAGGVKFEPILGSDVAQHGPKDSFGGNVHPSCSPEPGNGGQWNHVAHSLMLHFMGTDIVQVECGNVPGIEPGSESPVTGFNYIEFSGIGWVQGIKGNKAPRQPVMFEARVEDRNEPGNERASAGENIDRYWLRVTDMGGTVFEVGTHDDPITITGGNLQLHESSCD